MRRIAGGAWIVARVHAGLRSGVTVDSVLIGMRAILSAPRSLSPATMGLGGAGRSESGGVLMPILYLQCCQGPHPQGAFP